MKGVTGMNDLVLFLIAFTLGALAYAIIGPF